MTCSRDTFFCQDLNKVMCGGTRERKRDREREGGAKQRLRCGGSERPKGRENHEISNPRRGITELHPSGWHRGVHVFACNYLHSCVHCAHVSLPQFYVNVARCSRAASAPCYQGSANPLAIITLSYTACSSPYLKTLPHAFHTNTNIRQHPQQHLQLQEYVLLFVLTFPPISESPKSSTKKISGGKPPVNANSASSKVPCSDTRRFTSA